jgi:hypothetical protein
VIYFISGHRNITADEFNDHYKPALDLAIESGGTFVVGDYYGVDIMAQKYLHARVPEYRVTVYHMLEAPRNYVHGFNTKGGYYLDEDRDSAMTSDSNVDIAWSRSIYSGTFRNIRRRAMNDLHNLDEFIVNQLSGEDYKKYVHQYHKIQQEVYETRTNIIKLIGEHTDVN